MFYSPIVTQETVSGVSFWELYSIVNLIRLLHVFQVMRNTHIHIEEQTSDKLKARDFKELYIDVLYKTKLYESEIWHIFYWQFS